MKTKNQTMIFSALVAGLVVCGANTWQARGAPVDCGAVLTGSTTLQNDLLNCSGAALVIGADNITVDLNGHTLSSFDGLGVGISIAGHKGVTVKNGVIDGFQEAVLAQESSDLILEGLTIPSVSGNGVGPGFGWVAAIRILGGQNVVIKDSSISAPTFVGDEAGPDAIQLSSAKDVSVKNVHVNGGFCGVLVDLLPSTGEVKDCTFTDSYFGVFLINADGVTVRENVISGAYAGIRIGFLDFLPLGDVSILGNELFGNNWPIISFFLPTGEEWKPGPLYNCQIKENWAHDNYQGISLVNAQNCTVSENLVENNYRFGIALFTVSSGNKVSENTVTGSTEYFGIGLAWSLDNEPVPGPSGNLISENTATGNTQYDLFHGEFSTPNVWRKNVYNTKSGADIP